MFVKRYNPPQLAIFLELISFSTGSDSSNCFLFLTPSLLISNIASFTCSARALTYFPSSKSLQQQTSRGSFSETHHRGYQESTPRDVAVDKFFSALPENPVPYRTLVEKKRRGVPFTHEECAAASSVFLAENVGAFEASQYWPY